MLCLDSGTVPVICYAEHIIYAGTDAWIWSSISSWIIECSVHPIWNRSSTNWRQNKQLWNEICKSWILTLNQNCRGCTNWKAFGIAYDLLISHDVIGQSSKSQVGRQWNMDNDVWRRSRETGNIHNWAYIFVLNDAVRFVTDFPSILLSPAMLHYYLNCWSYTLPC